MSEPIDLVVPNIAEFNLRRQAAGFDPAVVQGFAAAGATLADQSVFWCTGPRVVILSAGLDRLWFSDIHRALALAEPTVVSPAPRSGLLLDDLLRDGQALARLRDALDGHGRVRLQSWGATEGVYQLAAVVRGWGADVELDGPAEKHYWSSLYLDCKMSCLDFASRLPGFRVPPGYTVDSWPELAGALAAVLAGCDEAIVKSMHGVGGEGSAVVRAAGPGLEAFWRAANRDPFFRRFPLSVQEYVPHAPGVGCPAVDMRITDTGVASLVLSMMTVDRNRFRSVSVGPGTVPSPYAQRLADLGTHVGLAARELGYRGWFCIDCLIGRDGELYVTEFNARRSGAMHSIALLQRRASAGAPAGEWVTHSHDSIPVRSAGRASYECNVRPVFERLWSQGVQAFPTSVRGLRSPRQELATLAVAPTADEAEEIIQKIGCAVSPRHGSARPGKLREVTVP